MDKKKIVSVIAAAAAIAFIAAPMTATVAQAHSKVKCYGANSCKGKGSCKTAQNACKGKNSCKGKGGMRMMSAEKCKKLGGSTTAPDASTDTTSSEPASQ